MPASPPADPGDPPLPVDDAVLRDWALPLDPDGDKNVRGSVLVVGGACSTPGAVLLAGIAALRTGAGRLQLATVASVAAGLALAAPEALVEALPETGAGTIDPSATERLSERLERCDAVLLGPGMQGHDEVCALAEDALPHIGDDHLVVLDAAMLTCLPSVAADAVARVRGRMIVTPNPYEAAELAGEPRDVGDAFPAGDELDRIAGEVARRYGAVVATRGLVVAPDGRRWAIGAGGIGLGTSGSGDVLAGLVTGAAARCGDPAQAAVWGTYLHGAAADRLAARLGTVGFLARELLDQVPVELARFD